VDAKTLKPRATIVDQCRRQEEAIGSRIECRSDHLGRRRGGDAMMSDAFVGASGSVPTAICAKARKSDDVIPLSRKLSFEFLINLTSLKAS
jgi:hypothetical protein